MQSVLLVSGMMLALCSAAWAEPVKVTVDATHPGHRISRFLTGACIEDVNHEIYGGLYSQMIFGECFQEPPPALAPEGFKTLEGAWAVERGALHGPAGDGPKIIAEMEPFADGEVSVEVFFARPGSGNAGLITRVSNARSGSDSFDGYEVSLDCDMQMLRLGRHRHNWEHFSDTPCSIPVEKWTELKAIMTGNTIEAFVDGQRIVRYEDSGPVLGAGTVGLRQWKRAAMYRNLQVATGGTSARLPFENPAKTMDEISGMWRAVHSGTATGTCHVEKENAFLGAQSQAITFIGGEGSYGIENRGLNRWGLCFKESASYEGVIWAKTESPAEIWVALENGDGSVTYAETRLDVSAGDWQRLPFELVSNRTEAHGRFVAVLKKASTVRLGYAFLQPGDWGRFKGLPIRRDVTEKLIDEGVTLLRYGGSMVNHAEYRWKNMIGPRDRRPPYTGTWYPYSTNGWGIIDFMNACEAAGFEYVPAFNANETPQDMADFIQYAKGAVDTPWGKKRAEDGHPEPYKLRYIEIGNEEHVDEKYAARFAAIAEAVWPLDPGLVLVVGDFVYGKPIRDPFQISGHASGLTTLKGQQQILDVAREHNREVWFDLHVGTDGPRPDGTLDAMFTFIDALESLAQGAHFHVVVFEFNAGNHQHRRGLANALAMNAIARDGRIPVAASANCLQPDGQNDNAWDQGLLFLDPVRTWLQSPGCVLRMVSRHYQPVALQTTVSGTDRVDMAAQQSEDGKTLVLHVVNVSDQPALVRLALSGFPASSGLARVETLSAPLDAVNTADDPMNVAPQASEWPYTLENGETDYTFAPYSFTVIEFR